MAGVTNLFAIAGHFVSYRWVSGPHNFLVILWNLLKTNKNVQQKQTTNETNKKTFVWMLRGPHEILLWAACSPPLRCANVYLHLYRQKPEMDNQNVDFAYPWKNFADSHACVIWFYNLISALYFALINHFCVIRVPFVPASRLACYWMCDSPRTGCARRLTTIYMWREQTKT